MAAKTIANLLAEQHQLVALSDSPGLDAELLLCHVLQQSRSYLRTWPDRAVSDEQQQQFLALLARRVQGHPIAYLLGTQAFWTLDLDVSPSTLIPRPETELLVEKSLALFDTKKIYVLDLGTGTGAVALALASERPDWEITAVDVVSEAVALAKHNAHRHKLNRIELLQSDWFKTLQGRRFDLIVSNPPYIDQADSHLQQGDVRFEPRSALVADNHGLADIEKIIHAAPDYLNPKGWLLFEHGYQQAAAARDGLRARGFSDIFTDTDLSGLDRISGGRLHGIN